MSEDILVKFQAIPFTFPVFWTPLETSKFHILFVSASLVTTCYNSDCLTSIM